MTESELQALLDGSEPPLLIHVLPGEIFAARRIPGSRNACVFETAFPEQVAALTSDKNRTMVIYGAGEGSEDVAVAAEKLAALGYTDVRRFDGGLASWNAAGMPIESDGDLPAAPVLDGTFLVDTGESLIRWTGRNLFNHHSGTVRLADGEITLRANALVSARFRVALDSIACEDITEPTMNQMLIAHLKSDDFFDVANHPTAAFVADRATPISGCTDGTPNQRISGRFTLRGVTRELDFPVLIASADGKRITAQGLLDLDRTEFGSIYGSGRFFRFLGKHLVNDHIHLHLKLHAELQA